MDKQDLINKADEIVCILIKESEEAGCHNLPPPEELKKELLEGLSREKTLFAKGYQVLLETLAAKKGGATTEEYNPPDALQQGFIKI